MSNEKRYPVDVTDRSKLNAAVGLPGGHRLCPGLSLAGRAIRASEKYTDSVRIYRTRAFAEERWEEPVTDETTLANSRSAVFDGWGSGRVLRSGFIRPALAELGRWTRKPVSVARTLLNSLGRGMPRQESFRSDETSPSGKKS